MKINFKNFKKNLLIISGTLSVGLGILGMFLPLLPTTPFLLLAAYCYARSSIRFYNWLISNRWCGEYIRNYQEGKGIMRKHKVLAMVLLWLTISYSLWLISAWWVKFLLLGIATGVSIHLLRLRTYRLEEEGRANKNYCSNILLISIISIMAVS